MNLFFKSMVFLLTLSLIAACTKGAEDTLAGGPGKVEPVVQTQTQTTVPGSGTGAKAPGQALPGPQLTLPPIISIQKNEMGGVTVGESFSETRKCENTINEKFKIAKSQKAENEKSESGNTDLQLQEAIVNLATFHLIFLELQSENDFMGDLKLSEAIKILDKKMGETLELVFDSKSEKKSFHICARVDLVNEEQEFTAENLKYLEQANEVIRFKLSSEATKAAL